MRASQNTLYYGVSALLFIILKFCYTFSDTASLQFLLFPTHTLVELLTGCKAVYSPETGYYYQDLDIVIEKSCSGFNFWLICFMMLCFLMVKTRETKSSKLLSIPFSLAAAYVITLIVNTSRIFVSVIVQQQADKLLVPRPHHVLHEVVGVITNFTFLILIYLFTENYLLKKQNHAKSA